MSSTVYFYFIYLCTFLRLELLCFMSSVYDMFHFETTRKNDVIRNDSPHSIFMSEGTLCDFNVVKIDILSSPLLKCPQSLAAVNQPVIPVGLAQLFWQTLPKCHKLQTCSMDFVPL